MHIYSFFVHVYQLLTLKCSHFLSCLWFFWNLFFLCVLAPLYHFGDFQMSGDSSFLKHLKWRESHSIVCDSLRPHGLYSPWNPPGRNTGVGTVFLLQGIFPTQGSNTGLLHYRQIIYQLSHKGSPRILEWVAYPFSSRSSQPRNWTGVSWIAGDQLS